MQITSIKQRKTANLAINLLLFTILIGFCTSTLNMSNINSNLNEDIIVEKLFLGDLSVLMNKKNIVFVFSIIENEKNEIIEKKSLEDFNNTFTFKFINMINNNIQSNYIIIPIKEINIILNYLIRKISEIYKFYIKNDFFLKNLF